MPHIVPKYFYLITVEFPMPDGGVEKAASSGVFQALPPNPPLAKPDPMKGTKMEMTYVGGLAGWIHKGEPSRYVGGMSGGVYKNTGRCRFVGGSVGRIYEPEPRLYAGGMVGWVSCQAAASAAPEPRYVLAS